MSEDVYDRVFKVEYSGLLDRLSVNSLVVCNERDISTTILFFVERRSRGVYLLCKLQR